MKSLRLLPLIAPARWSTASAPSTRSRKALGSDKLPWTTSMGGPASAGNRGIDRASTRRRQPRRVNSPARWPPMKPVTPVTAASRPPPSLSCRSIRSAPVIEGASGRTVRFCWQGGRHAIRRREPPPLRVFARDEIRIADFRRRPPPHLPTHPPLLPRWMIGGWVGRWGGGRRAPKGREADFGTGAKNRQRRRDIKPPAPPPRRCPAPGPDRPVRSPAAATGSAHSPG